MEVTAGCSAPSQALREGGEFPQEVSLWKLLLTGHFMRYNVELFADHLHGSKPRHPDWKTTC